MPSKMNASRGTSGNSKSSGMDEFYNFNDGRMQSMFNISKHAGAKATKKTKSRKKK